jgi:UDP-2,3-diacylglucosamine hydrolase
MQRGNLKTEILGKKFFLGHGDGLGPGDTGYKLLKLVFTNKVLQWMFKRLHPDFSLWLGQGWSTSRGMIDRIPEFYGIDKEWIILYAKEQMEKEFFDYFVFGHRHIPGIHQIGEKTTYINLGDWVHHFTYGVFDGDKFDLIKFEELN